MLIAFLVAIGFMVLEAKGNLPGEDCGLYYNMMFTLATGVLAILMPIEKWNNTKCKLILCGIILVAIEVVIALLCVGDCSCLNISKTVLSCVFGFVFSIRFSAVGKEKQDNVKKLKVVSRTFKFNYHTLVRD